MKKLLLLLFLIPNLMMADDSDGLFEKEFNKALQNHLYFFKFKNQIYTTNKRGKAFDFFDHGYNYHEASVYMQKNYAALNGVSDGNFGCMRYKGELHSFTNYLDYDETGWKKKTITKSKDDLVTVVLSSAATCLYSSNYFKVYFNGVEIFDSRPDFKGLNIPIGLNINSYIDKDYNLNGKNELFIDAGYPTGAKWDESYYFFEYDKNSIKLIKNFRAIHWDRRLEISDHHNSKFIVPEAELIKVITDNFKVD